jgi:phosphoribosyl-AMP cyclohydrolase
MKQTTMGSDNFSDRLPSTPSVKGFLDALRFDENGLVTVVVQDSLSGDILMLAHADRKALEMTLRTGVMHYYSRSRKKLWKKGEESGNEQSLDNLYVDCDGDALVAQVRQVKAACHLGYRSCFSNHVSRDGKVINVGRKLIDPEKVYSKKKG